MTDDPAPGYDGYEAWIDFADIDAERQTVAYTDFIRVPRDVQLAAGTRLTAGDDAGNRCSAEVVSVSPVRVPDRVDRVVLRLDLDTFTSA